MKLPTLIEVDAAIPEFDPSELPDALQVLPLNLWANDQYRLEVDTRAIIDANKQNNIAFRITPYFLMQLFWPGTTEAVRKPLCTVEDCVDNFSLMWARFPKGLFDQLSYFNDTLHDAKKYPKIILVECEFDLYSFDPRDNNIAACEQARTALIDRGIANADWGAREWRWFCFGAYSSVLERIFRYFGWMYNKDFAWFITNAHGDDRGLYLDQNGVGIPPVPLSSGQVSDLYSYEPKREFDAMAQNFVVANPGAIVHQSIDNPRITERCVAVRTSGGNNCIFVGNGKEKLKDYPGSRGAAAVEVCHKLKGL